MMFAKAADGFEQERSFESGIDNQIDLYPDKTVQSDVDGAEINKLVKRFGLTTDEMPDPAIWDHMGDFSDVVDLHTMMNRVVESRQAFESLPSTLREVFGNNPANLLEFLEDPRNAEDAARMGLLTPEAAQAILVKKEVVPDVKEPPVT